MEPEGSVAHLQEPATCPYPEPQQSTPCLLIPCLEEPFSYYLLIYAYVFQVVSFPQVSPPKSCMHLSCPIRAKCPTHPILLDLMTLIIFGEEYRSYILHTIKIRMANWIGHICVLKHAIEGNLEA
jgi:hypothetical protein